MRCAHVSRGAAGGVDCGSVEAVKLEPIGCHVPLALRECFDHVHWRITRSGSVPDYATVVAVEIMSSRWWPSRLPCPRRVGAAVIARLAETEGRF